MTDQTADPLYLDAIRAECDLADRDLRKWVRYPVKHLRALIEEVERLRAATVKPDREAVARALYDDDLAQGWVAEVWDDLPPETSEWYRSQADAVLAMWPGRTEAEVRADEQARIVTMLEEDASDVPALTAGVMRARRLVRDRADRLAAEGGAS